VVTEPYFGLVHFVVDLGLDRVFAYRVDAQKGALVQKGVIALPKGKGPRHLVFHPSRRAAYLVNELDSTVSCFRVRLPSRWLANDGPGDEETGEESCSTPGATLELVSCVSSLPVSEQGKTTISPQGIWKAASHSSEIRMHPRASFFVVGNRGHDSVAVFRVKDFAEKPDGRSSGGIELVGITPSGGECPRNFDWAANGKFLVVGNQNSSTMCAFAFDENAGTLSPKPVSVARVASPNYVFAAPMNEALAGSISARRTRENSVMSMQTQQIVVEDAVAGDAESAPASAVAAVAA
jgi:6-phosphogluconolactonase (cycloisomerase 2 family)